MSSSKHDKIAEMVKRVDAALKVVRPSSLSCRFAELDNVRGQLFGTAKEQEKKSDVRAMRQAKVHSDKREYEAKHRIMRGLIMSAPNEFIIDSEQDGILGITHTPSGFRMHLPRNVLFGAELQQPPKEKVASSDYLFQFKVAGKNACLNVEEANGPWAETRGLAGRDVRGL